MVDTRSEFTALRIKIPSLVLPNANTQASPCAHVHRATVRFIDRIEADSSAVVSRGRRLRSRNHSGTIESST